METSIKQFLKCSLIIHEGDPAELGREIESMNGLIPKILLHFYFISIKI